MFFQFKSLKIIKTFRQNSPSMNTLIDYISQKADQNSEIKIGVSMIARQPRYLQQTAIYSIRLLSAVDSNLVYGITILVRQQFTRLNYYLQLTAIWFMELLSSLDIWLPRCRLSTFSTLWSISTSKLDYLHQIAIYWMIYYLRQTGIWFVALLSSVDSN